MSLPAARKDTQRPGPDVRRGRGDDKPEDRIASARYGHRHCLPSEGTACGVLREALAEPSSPSRALERGLCGLPRTATASRRGCTGARGGRGALIERFQRQLLTLGDEALRLPAADGGVLATNALSLVEDEVLDRRLAIAGLSQRIPASATPSSPICGIAIRRSRRRAPCGCSSRSRSLAPGPSPWNRWRCRRMCA